MSKGPGRVERGVSEHLIGGTCGWLTMSDLAGAIDVTDSPSRSQIESVRRACRRLAAAGRAELDYYHDGRLWSALGDGRNACDPDHRPAHPCWQLVVRKR
jgi:hypothetical protein